MLGGGDPRILDFHIKVGQRPTSGQMLHEAGTPLGSPCPAWSSDPLDGKVLVIHTDSLEATPGDRLDQIVDDLALIEREGRARREAEDAEMDRRHEIAERVNRQLGASASSRQLGKQNPPPAGS